MKASVFSSLLALSLPLLSSAGRPIQRYLSSSTLSRRLLNARSNSIDMTPHGFPRDSDPTAAVLEDEPTPPKDYFIELPVDPSGVYGCNETFKNRYWVYDEYWKPEIGGPVFVDDAGESSIEGLIIDVTNFNRSMMMQYAKEFNALIVVWEHRYYGKSHPDLNGLNLTTAPAKEVGDWFKHHTAANALDDLATFAKTFEWPQTPDNSTIAPVGRAKPQDVPWVMFGGSYPGMRTAWMQKRHPGLFRAGLASSAPVELNVACWEYFVGAERLLENGYKNCSADMRAVADWVTKATEEKNETAIDMFLGKAEKVATKTDSWDERIRVMVNMFMGTWVGAYQYNGIYGSENNVGLGQFCDYLETGAGQTETPMAPLEKGLVEKFGVEKTALMFAKAVNDLYDNLDDAMPTNVTTNEDGSPDDYTSWDFQICIEQAAFTTANTTRPSNIMPGFANEDFFYTDCQRQFGLGPIEDLYKAVDKLNNEWGGWDLESANLIWTDGEFDPWRFMGIDDSIPEHNRLHRPNLTTEIPDCGTPLEKGTQIHYLIKDGHHCSDWRVIGPQNIKEGNHTIVTPNGNVTMVVDNGHPIWDAVVAQDLNKKALKTWLAADCKIEMQPDKPVSRITGRRH